VDKQHKRHNNTQASDKKPRYIHQLRQQSTNKETKRLRKLSRNDTYVQDAV